MRRDSLLLLVVIAGLGGACGGRGQVEPTIDPEKTPGVYGEEFLRLVNAPPVVVSEAGTPGLRTIAVSTVDPAERDFEVTVDVSEQVLRIRTPEEIEYGYDESKAVPTSLYRSFAEAELQHDAFLSAALLGVKAKAFDDGLCAAVELADGNLAARAELLQKILEAISPADAGGKGGRALISAALHLAGERVDVTPEMKQILAEFREDDSRSKPIGFYTWSRELIRVFQQGRLLQTELEAPEAKALAAALSKDSELTGSYHEMLTLAERLTNPLAHEDLRQASRALAGGEEPNLPDPSHFFPPSRSHETELILKLYGDRPIPDRFNLADEMVKRIRAGSLDLEPTAASGWYDHQVFALESLVIPEEMPEAKHLVLADTYRMDLVGLFKSLLALTRETHVKQLEGIVCGARAPGETIILEVEPSLTVEPLATYYLRRAKSYRFVRDVLEETYGREWLFELRRLTAGGPVNMPLVIEVRLMEALCHGAYLTTCDELGMKPEVDANLGFGKGPATDRALFRHWTGQIKIDPDLGRDVRMMVPIFYDIERRKLKVWAVLGVATKPMSISFEKDPTVVCVKEVTDGKTIEVPLEDVYVSFQAQDQRLGYLVTAELYVTRPLNREEFRDLCDSSESAQEILDRLAE